MKTLLLILLLCCPLMAQKLTIDYDKFADETAAEMRILNGGIASYWRGRYPGKTLQTTVKEFDLFMSGGNCYGYCFNHSSLRLLIDGERLQFTSDELADTIVFTLNRATVEHLASAKLVEFQIGRFTGKWQGKDLGRLQSLLDATFVK